MSDAYYNEDDNPLAVMSGVAPRTIFENATGIFPDFDAAAPRSGLRSVLANYFGTPAKRQERRQRTPWAPFVDPHTGERYQTWPERLIRSAATLPGDVAGGAVPAREFDPVTGEFMLSPDILERSQDLAGIMGGGPLTMRPGSATLASGAKRPPNIGDVAMPSRRDLFSAFRKNTDNLKQPDVEVGEPRAPLDVGQNAAPANLPAVIQPRMPSDMPHADLAGQLQARINPEINKRELIRGTASAVAAGSRAVKIADALTAKPTTTVPKEVLPKFEEIWKREGEFDLHRLTEDALEREFDAFAEEHGRNPTEKEYEAIVRDISDDAEKNPHEYTGRGWADESSDYDGPRYSDYQLPGGENYRELLIKHPDQMRSSPKYARYRELADIAEKRNLTDAEFKEFTSMEPELNKLNDQAFHSNSWDEPNVLGHIRMHDRDIPGVGKSTHVEELNSEWHQEGQRGGYKSPVDTTGWTAAKAAPVKGSSIGWEVKNKDGKHIFTGAGYGVESPQTAIEMAKRYVAERQVPDAPLKDTWPEYLLRRAVKEAVDNGHDAVSWTPGEHQFERYNAAYTPGGNNPVHESYNNLKQPLLDFYDKHLVDVANKIGKEYGTKVEKRALHNERFDPKERDKYARMSYEERVKQGVQEKYEKMIDMETTDRGDKQLGEVNAPVFRISPQLRKAVKDGTFSLLSDSSKPGAPLAALENAPHFYSAVERAVDAAKLNKATPEQWLGYLRNQPGVRQEEIQHLGLDKLTGKQLSREEIAKHVKNNGVKLEETWKQSTPDSRFVDGTEPKYDSYQLPGGSNYRELLMRTPDTAANDALEAFRAKMIKKYGGGTENKIRRVATPEEMQKFSDLNDAAFKEGSSRYRSSHWDEPNVLGHVRMNDRDVPGVGKSLHLEELQSDWHQAGRKRGYEGQDPRLTTDELEESRALHGRLGSGEKLSASEMSRMDELQRRHQRSLSDVPDAPFKSTWPDLLLKRSLREAVDNGYDAISWTPGEHQSTNPKKLGRTGEAAGKSDAGMKGFYDKMLVDKANALGKKYGAKVEWKDIETIPARRDAWWEGKKPAETQSVPVLKLTPEFKDAVKKGFALFSDSGKPGAPLAALENVGRSGVPTDTGPRYNELHNIAARRNLTEAENTELAALQERRSPRGLREVPQLDPTEAALQSIRRALELAPDRFEETRPGRNEAIRRKEEAARQGGVSRERPAPEDKGGPLGGLPGARAAFHEHIGKYIPEDEFARDYFAGMHTPSIKMRLINKSGVFNFGGNLERNGNYIGNIDRDIDFKNGVAHHHSLSLEPKVQGSGIAKDLLRNQIGVYHRLGLNRVETFANIEVGSYAWAKYGFLPDDAAWSRVAHGARERLQQMEGNGDIDGHTAVMLEKVLKNKDPRAMWDLADFVGRTRQGDHVSKKLLMKSNGWDAVLDLYDPESMNRFSAYTRKGK